MSRLACSSREEIYLTWTNLEMPRPRQTGLPGSVLTFDFQTCMAHWRRVVVLWLCVCPISIGSSFRSYHMSGIDASAKRARYLAVVGVGQEEIDVAGSDLSDDALVELARKTAKELMRGNDASHDYSHAFRVQHNQGANGLGVGYTRLQALQLVLWLRSACDSGCFAYKGRGHGQDAVCGRSRARRVRGLPCGHASGHFARRLALRACAHVGVDTRASSCLVCRLL